MKLKYLLLILIILFSIFIRTFKIGSLPPSLYYDEVDAGYQAMIFNQNQTDYFGNKFPIHFHSFGDFRTSLQIYSIALLQKIKISPDISVRLPSAIFGIISTILMFLITKSIIPSFLLAISPWSIHYSRIGFEVSGMIMCILFGIYFWKNFINNKKIIYVYLSILFFCLSSYFYSTSKLFLIFIGLVIISIWTKEIKLINPKKIILLVIFSTLILFPMILDTIKGNAGYRFSYISIFTLPHREQIVDTQRYQDVLTDHPNEIGLKTSTTSKLFHNKYQLIFQRFINNYVNSFSPDFLLLKGDNNQRHGFGEHGLIYFLDVIFVSIGIFLYFNQKTKNKISTLFFMLLLLSPIPFSLTRDVETPHATRLILMLPSIIYFSYLGLNHIKKINFKLYLVLILLYALSFINFWHYYYYHYSQTSAIVWNTGMKEAVIASNKYPNDTLVFSDNYTSFISFFLFYHPYNLSKNNSLQNDLVQYSDTSFSGQILNNKYYFGNINWTNLSHFDKNTVYIVPMSEYKAKHLENYAILQTVEKRYYNQEGFYLIKTNEKQN